MGERGRYGIVILVAVTLTYFTENFLRSAPSALSPVLIEELGLSYGMAGVLFSSYFILYALMQLPSGILSEALGPRKTIIGFTVFTVAGALLFYAAHDFRFLILAQLLIGLGSSVFYINAARLTVGWFPPERQASAIGILSASSGLGNFASYMGFPLAIGAIGGWRPLYLYCSIMMVATFVANVFLLKENPDARNNNHDPGGPSLWTLVKTTLRDRRIYPYIVGYILMSFCWVFFTWLNQYFIDTRGLSYIDVGVISSAGTIMGIPGCILVGVISDRLRKRKLPLIVFSVLGNILLIALIYAPAGLPTLAYAALNAGIGFSLSIWVLFFPMISETLPPETVGIAQGLVNGVGTLSFSLMSPIYGSLVDLTGGYGYSNIMVVVTGILATVVYFLFTEETYGGNHDH